MKHVSIVVPAGNAVLSSIVGSYKIFSAINNFLKKTGLLSEDFYHIDLVGLQDEAAYFGGAFNARPSKTINEVRKTDLIIVTALLGDMEKELQINAPFVPWIREQRIKNNAEVASLCMGAFLLAETGLLNGKSCATHWSAHQAFRQMYPQINLMGEKIITDDNGIYSSGGAYSFLNLLLHLVEKYNGREVAIWCSKMFEIEFDRSDQNQFVIFRGQKEHSDEHIKVAQRYIEDNFSEKLSVEELADRVAISRRNFVRRFKKATSNTPLEYIQRVKIEAAKKNLESSTKNINEVMFDVGYSDTKAFRNVFKKHAGLSPIDYRNKYNREMARA
jgi:transcriptional regulator GlxA family with amidase domain